MEKKLLPDDLFGAPQPNPSVEAPQTRKKASPAIKKPLIPPDVVEALGAGPKTKKAKKTVAAPKPAIPKKSKAPVKKVAQAAKKPIAATVKAKNPEPQAADGERRKMIEEFKRRRASQAVASKEQVVFSEPPVRFDKPLVTEKKFDTCPSCVELLPDNARVCPHCYSPIIECPYCSRRASALENPKMATEQRFNRILKQYTLFSPALPSMPLQPILDCSECKSRVIICESCHTALKHSAQTCPSCGEQVRMTKLLLNPLTLLEMILKRPDALKGIQKLIEMLLSSQSK